ncbi:MAG: hypothetical protein KGH72_02260 [Candidatus Micrarchaeota archaeon]|nr:hypothetical protein [Candidatus Micrarchaeota archaeon]
MAEELVRETRRTLGNRDIEELFEEGILPYFIASGVLAFCGRDIDTGSVARIVSALGIKPDPKLLDTVAGLRYKNRIVYIVALYCLIGNSIEPSEAKIMGIVSAIDIHPDASIARDAMALYRKRLEGGNKQPQSPGAPQQ